MNKETIPKMLEELIEISRDAGNIILNYYDNPEQSIQIKEDESPLTKADTESNEYICGKLKELYNIPIISEECYDAYDIRKDYSEFFLVDPLDGTKEFIERNGEFTVNIAYVKNKRPVMGVIYVPASGTTFFAAENFGSYVEDRNGTKKLPLNELPKGELRLPAAESIVQVLMQSLPG
ncbi:3'(2'),5'-bisphosphate nucleotidase CysQ family protein [Methanohalophilus profundi]|uniref:3'(2'),5'-bisphosphate nucleotidase CysQ family protein n=1 Tax=Methanohalophilus profundi TaxID=2138083 RepID=UPI00101D993B|nr:3'(2'),5'-bisphosphate nucleotidase CysQ [Methanohalophilus profundi]